MDANESLRLGEKACVQPDVASMIVRALVSTVDWSVASWSLDTIRGIDFKQTVKGVQ